MTVEEYLYRLSECLRQLPEQERVAALSYYDEFFIEASDEDPAAVMEKLGPPEKVAASILADYKVMTPGPVVEQEPPPQEPEANMSLGLLLLLLICLSPVWITVIAVAAVLAAVTAIVMVVLFVCGGACAVAAVAAVVWILSAGVTGAANFLFLFGLLAAVLGLGLVLAALGMLLVRGVAAAFRGVGNLCRWIFRRRECV